MIRSPIRYRATSGSGPSSSAGSSRRWGYVLLLPLVLVQGYFLRVLRSAADDESEPPVFDRWGELFVDGIKLLAVQFIYLLVPAVVLFAGLSVAGFGAFSEFGGTDTGTAIELVGWGILLVGTLLVPAAVYLLPAAVANVASEDTFLAAFDRRTLATVALTTDYLVAVVLALVVGTVLGGIAAVLSLLLVGVFLAFYVQVVVYYLLGRGYAGGLRLEPRGSRDTEGTPVA